MSADPTIADVLARLDLVAQSDIPHYNDFLRTLCRDVQAALHASAIPREDRERALHLAGSGRNWKAYVEARRLLRLEDR